MRFVKFHIRSRKIIMHLRALAALVVIVTRVEAWVILIINTDPATVPIIGSNHRANSVCKVQIQTPPFYQKGSINVQNVHFRCAQ